MKDGVLRLEYESPTRAMLYAGPVVMGMLERPSQKEPWVATPSRVMNPVEALYVREYALELTKKHLAFPTLTLLCPSTTWKEGCGGRIRIDLHDGGKYTCFCSRCGKWWDGKAFGLEAIHYVEGFSGALKVATIPEQKPLKSPELAFMFSPPSLPHEALPPKLKDLKNHV